MRPTNGAGWFLFFSRHVDCVSTELKQSQSYENDQHELFLFFAFAVVF